MVANGCQHFDINHTKFIPGNDRAYISMKQMRIDFIYWVEFYSICFCQF